MAVAALSQLPFTDWLGFIWLTPYLLTLNSPQRLQIRLGNAIISAALPAVYAMAGAIPQAPLTSLTGMGLWMTPFLVATLLAPQNPKLGLFPRALVAAATLLGALTAIRQVGMPVSLSLLAPVTPVNASIIASGGILLLDALILTWQIALACLCVLIAQRHHSRQIIYAVFHLAAAALLLALIPQLPAGTSSGTEKIAVVQTANASASREALVLGERQSIDALDRSRLIQTLQRLDADWAIWPESSYPSLISPRNWARQDPAPGEMQHGYVYFSPGNLQSLVIGQTPDKQPIRIEKRNPLPFAESALRKPTVPQASVHVDGRKTSVLVCSDGLIPALVRQERKRGTELIITPSNSAYLGSGLLGRLQQKAMHLIGIHQGLPIIFVANGGPSAVLHPSGHALSLLPAHHAAVAVIKPPFANARKIKDAALTLAISLGTWTLMAVTGRYAPAPSLPKNQTHQRGIHLLIIAAFGMAIAASSTSLPVDAPIAAQSTQATKRILETTAHQQAVAGVAQRFGHRVMAWELPTNGMTALRWLCERTALLPRAKINAPAAAPAIGFVDTGEGLQTVDWTLTSKPYRLDLRTGQAHPISQKNPAIHWLTAVNTPKDCRLADDAWESINGTRQPLGD